MRRSWLLALATLASLTGVIRAEQIYGVTSAATPDLVFFDSANPNGVTTVGAISGIVAGQTLRGIDFRPADGLLYAISNVSTTDVAQLYTIDLATAVATPIGAGLSLAGNTSTRISLDFNPVANALRVVTGNGQNYRVNANTGALISQDTSINPGTPLIAGIAYTNNFVGATQTTLFAYDFLTDNIGTIGDPNGVPNSPNTGIFNVVGSAGIVSFNAGMGFDISGTTGIAYVSMDESNTPGTVTEVYTVNLATGALTQIGSGEQPVALLDISVVPSAVPEPGTLALGGLALGGVTLMVRRRRNRRKRAAMPK